MGFGQNRGAIVATLWRDHSARGKRLDLRFLPLADPYCTRQEDRVALFGAIEKLLAQDKPAD